MKLANQPSVILSLHRISFSVATFSAIFLICLRVFPKPTFPTVIVNSLSFFSSSLVKYGLAPGFVPCITLPDILSCKVVFGTSY